MNTNAQVILLVPMNPVPSIVQPTAVFTQPQEAQIPNSFYQPFPLMQTVMIPQMMMAPQQMTNNLGGQQPMPQTAFPVQMMVPNPSSANNIVYQMVAPAAATTFQQQQEQQPTMVVTQAMPIMQDQINGNQMHINLLASNNGNDAGASPQTNVNGNVKRIDSGAAVGSWNSNTSHSSNNLSHSNSGYITATSNDSCQSSETATTKSIDTDDVSVYQGPKKHCRFNTNIDTGPRKFRNIFANTDSPIDTYQREKPSAFKDVYLEKSDATSMANTRCKQKKSERIKRLKRLDVESSDFSDKPRKRKLKRVLPPLRIELISKPHILKSAASEPTPFQKAKDDLLRAFQSYATTSSSSMGIYNYKRINTTTGPTSSSPCIRRDSDSELTNGTLSCKRVKSGANIASSLVRKCNTNQRRIGPLRTIRFSDSEDQQEQKGKVKLNQLNENKKETQEQQQQQQPAEATQTKPLKYINVLSQEAKQDNTESGCKCCRKLAKETKKAMEPQKQTQTHSKISASEESKKDSNVITGSSHNEGDGPKTKRSSKKKALKRKEKTTTDENCNETGTGAGAGKGTGTETEAGTETGTDNEMPSKNKKKQAAAKKKRKKPIPPPEEPPLIIKRKPRPTCFECRETCKCQNLIASSECLPKCIRKLMTKDICKRCPGLLTYEPKPRLPLGLLRSTFCTFHPCYNAACGLSGHWECPTKQNKCPDCKNCDCCCKPA